jgi:SAM-dependent methyltransferase
VGEAIGESAGVSERYDRDFATVDLYTGFAYGHLLFGELSADAVYRTMRDLLLIERDVTAVLDVGCGVGRFLYDCAPVMTGARFVGVDLSANMCVRAQQILRGSEPIPLDVWERRGRRGVVFDAVRDLGNVSIARASAERLPFASMMFDVVASTLVLCRLGNPEQGLAEMVRVLKRGGRLLLATPFGFNEAELWERFYPPERLREKLEMLGLRVEEWVDGVMYREVFDVWGNAQEWRVTVIAARLMV